MLSLPSYHLILTVCVYTPRCSTPHMERCQKCHCPHVDSISLMPSPSSPQKRGVTSPHWCSCQSSDSSPGCRALLQHCGQSCVLLAERVDIRTPDCRAWLDRVCPTRESCALVYGNLCSCYCCHRCAELCADVSFCPEGQAVQVSRCSRPPSPLLTILPRSVLTVTVEKAATVLCTCRNAPT